MRIQTSNPAIYLSFWACRWSARAPGSISMAGGRFSKSTTYDDKQYMHSSYEPPPTYQLFSNPSWKIMWQNSNPPFGQKLNASIVVPYPTESCLSGIWKNVWCGDIIIIPLPPHGSLIFSPHNHLLHSLISGTCTTKGFLRLPLALVARSCTLAPLTGWPPSTSMANWWPTTRAGNERNFFCLFFLFPFVPRSLSACLSQLLSLTRFASFPTSYSRFHADITAQLKGAGSSNELLVYVFDPSNYGGQVFGKQRVTAIDSPGGDTYTPSSGIWQTVWLENVPQTYVTNVRITPDLTGINVTVNATSPSTVSLQVLDGGSIVAKTSGASGSLIRVNVPSPKLWSPDSPHLYNLSVTVGSDTVYAYFGLRTFTLGQVGSQCLKAISFEVTFYSQMLQFAIGLLPSLLGQERRYPAHAQQSTDFHGWLVGPVFLARRHLHRYRERAVVRAGRGDRGK